MLQGFDVEFLEPLPRRYECVICMLALFEPVQLDCGHRFCSPCFKQHSERGKPVFCPLDRTKVDDLRMVFRDKAVEREILDLHCKCIHHKKRCDWQGELREYQDHLKVCLYEELNCTNPGCNFRMLRKDMKSHLDAHCLYRRVTCQYCKEMYLAGESEGHKKECKSYPVSCVNKCGAKNIPRDQMAKHLNDCPLTLVPCSFANIGCNIQYQKVKEVEHMDGHVKHHLNLAVNKISLLETTCKKQSEDLKYCLQRIDFMEGETKLVKKHNMHSFKIKNFREQLEEKKKNNGSIRSEPFIIFLYKLRLTIYLNGDGKGKGTHLGMFLNIMRGEYDDILEWPFRKRITFSILDMGGKQQHFKDTLKPEAYLRASDKQFHKPVSECNRGWGFADFISHKKLLEGNFIKDNTLTIRCELE